VKIYDFESMYGEDYLKFFQTLHPTFIISSDYDRNFFLYNILKLNTTLVYKISYDTKIVRGHVFKKKIIKNINEVLNFEQPCLKINLEKNVDEELEKQKNIDKNLYFFELIFSIMSNKTKLLIYEDIKILIEIPNLKIKMEIFYLCFRLYPLIPLKNKCFNKTATNDLEKNIFFEEFLGIISLLHDSNFKDFRNLISNIDCYNFDINFINYIMNYFLYFRKESIKIIVPIEIKKDFLILENFLNEKIFYEDKFENLSDMLIFEQTNFHFDEKKNEEYDEIETKCESVHNILIDNFLKNKFDSMEIEGDEKKNIQKFKEIYHFHSNKLLDAKENFQKSKEASEKERIINKTFELYSQIQKESALVIEKDVKQLNEKKISKNTLFQKFEFFENFFDEKYNKIESEIKEIKFKNLDDLNLFLEKKIDEIKINNSNNDGKNLSLIFYYVLKLKKISNQKNKKNRKEQKDKSMDILKKLNKYIFLVLSLYNCKIDFLIEIVKEKQKKFSITEDFVSIENGIWEITENLEFFVYLISSYKNFYEKLKIKNTEQLLDDLMVKKKFYMSKFKNSLNQITKNNKKLKIEIGDDCSLFLKYGSFENYQLNNYLYIPYLENDIVKKFKLNFIPDDWQFKFIENVNKNNSILVCAPTSSGKTFLSFYVFQKVLSESDDGTVLFICPTIALV
jgi:hypothetical protein